MIADLHTHTFYAHGKNSVREMFLAGQRHGLRIHGFSEHSPRPAGYDYPQEYRDKLNAGFADYVRDVLELKAEQAQAACGLPGMGKDGARVPQGQDAGDACILLGLEMDWLEDELPFMQSVAASYPFAYIIGGIHFLGTWGFDAAADDWTPLSQKERFACYERYYRTMRRMAESGLFQIIAHPDLIKIFSIEDFRSWIERAESLELVASALLAAKDAGMAMEISSAGLRKPCQEIYPGPRILELASGLGVPISFGSDGHCVNTIAHGFPELARYAHSYGYTESLVFDSGNVTTLRF